MAKVSDLSKKLGANVTSFFELIKSLDGLIRYPKKLAILHFASSNVEES